MDAASTGSFDTNSQESDDDGDGPDDGDKTLGVENGKHWLCLQGWPCPMTQEFHQEFVGRHYYAEQHTRSSCPPFHWHTYFAIVFVCSFLCI